MSIDGTERDPPRDRHGPHGTAHTARRGAGDGLGCAASEAIR